MVKIILMMVFMSLMIFSSNMMIMFYYNLCYFMSLMMLFMYMNKGIYWFNISGVVGVNCYSYMLIILSMWVIGLMFMCLVSGKEAEIDMKMMIFILMMLLLSMFFMLMDFIVFYLVFELSLIPTFFLIIYWGANLERVSASFYMMMYMLLVSFPLLVYIFDMYMYSFSLKFSIMVEIMGGYTFSFWSFLMIYMAFFIKMPVYMFHIWLPKAHVEAPVYGSMILAGVLLKMGGYGVIRLMEVFMKASVKYNYLVFSVSIIGSVMVSLVCLTQVDMKSLVAYSSVVHMNLMMCGLMTFFKMGMLSSYLMMVSHGLCSSGLFYIVNLYYNYSNSRLLILNKGMISNLSMVVFFWFLFCIVNFSFPVSLNFISEILILMMILNWDFSMILYLVMICFFSGAYSLYLFSYVCHGRNIYYENKFYSCSVNEYLVMIMHFFPLVLYLLKLDTFM